MAPKKSPHLTLQLYLSVCIMYNGDYVISALCALISSSEYAISNFYLGCGAGGGIFSACLASFVVAYLILGLVSRVRTILVTAVATGSGSRVERSPIEGIDSF